MFISMEAQEGGLGAESSVGLHTEIVSFTKRRRELES